MVSRDLEAPYINLTLSFDAAGHLYVKVDGSAILDGRCIEFRAEDRRGEDSGAARTYVDRTTMELLAKHFACAARRKALDDKCISVSVDLTRLFHAIVHDSGSNEFLFSTLAKYEHLQFKNKSRILLRIITDDPLLRRIPWEMMRRNATATDPIRPSSNASGFLGNTSGLFVVRTTQKCRILGIPSEVKTIEERIHVLSIFGEHVHAEQDYLECFYKAPAAANQKTPPIDYTDYIKNSTLGNSGMMPSGHHFFSRNLRDVNIIHIVAHGEIDKNGKHRLKFNADLDRPEGKTSDGWLETANLARLLCGPDDARYNEKPLPNLRLVILQACSSASTGPTNSDMDAAARLLPAVDIFLDAGVDVVLAFLSDVPADLARDFMRIFLRVLLDTPYDVAFAFREARAEQLRALSKQRSALFAPVLYLRGLSTCLFAFPNRARGIPLPPRPSTDTLVDSDLERLLRSPDRFTLLLGNLDQQLGDDEVSSILRKELVSIITESRPMSTEPKADSLARVQNAIVSRLPLHALAQLAMFYSGDPHSPARRIWEAFTRNERRSGSTSNNLYTVLGQRLIPGVHISLLWVPILENALAKLQPDKRIITIGVEWSFATVASCATPPPVHVFYLEPSDAQATVRTWRPLQTSSRASFTFSPEDIIVIRLNGGFMLTQGEPTLVHPAMTEDDFAVQARLFGGAKDLSRLICDNRNFSSCIDQFLGAGVFAVGLSVIDWPQRAFIRAMMRDRKSVNASIALLHESQQDVDLWVENRDFPTTPKRHRQLAEVVQKTFEVVYGNVE